jgi:hypothetical protein
MFDFVMGIIILVAVGSCVIQDACVPDKNGKTYKLCNQIFEKEKANK